MFCSVLVLTFRSAFRELEKKDEEFSERVHSATPVSFQGS